MNLCLLAEAAGRALSSDHANIAAHAVMSESVSRLTAAGQPVESGLLAHAIDTALLIGRGEEADALLGDVESLPGGEDPSFEGASLLLRLGWRKQSLGDGDGALAAFRSAESAFEAIDIERDAAICRGGIADILQGRGETDEALRIRREEQLPVFDRLGDMRSRAVTMGRIADILQGRGETDEALRIRREEELPVYDRLGDVRSRAVTMGQIADILEGRGETDEALRIRREEELPVYDRLGDVRSRAVTMGKIADILEGRGETDEALRIRREEQLPVYDRLGDVRSRAVTMGQIADILEGRGETDEALRIRREEQLPVFDRLGDVRSRAVTMGKIADILQGRGETDEALRIRREEQLPVYDRLGDVREKSVVLFKIAQSKLDNGGLERGEIQEIHDALAEAHGIALSLKMPDVVGATGFLLGQVLAVAGHDEEAMQVLEAAAAAFAVLGNQQGAEAAAEVLAMIEKRRGLGTA